MRFGVLGPVTASQDGRRIPVLTPMVRSLLAVLLVEANRPVSETRLTGALWGDDPPKSSKAALQNHVFTLRRSLDVSASSSVRRTHDGYLIEVASGELDLQDFEDLRCRGTSALESEHWQDAAEALSRALALWRGDPFADVLPATKEALYIERFRESRLQAVEQLAQARLQLGRFEEVITDLRPLVRDHPWREAAHSSLMHALYGAGRQADALTVYQDLRAHLVAELGVEPGAAVTALHQRILAADPTLITSSVTPYLSSASEDSVRLSTTSPADADPAREHGPRAQIPSDARSAPRQLPSAPRYFVGRADEALAMSRLLNERGSAVYAIIGAGGIGKTTLALAWSHRMTEEFPDGQLYVNLRGFDPGGTPVEPADAVAGLLHAFGVSAQRVPSLLADRQALFRTLVADKRVLVLLDNAADTDQVRELLPGGRDCLTIVTSRNRLAGLVATEGAQPFRLDPLDDVAAFDLLAARLGRQRAADDREALHSLISACAGLPLALAILAARLALEPDLDAAALASRLSDDRSRLTELGVAEATTDLRAVFSWSYRLLSPAAAELFLRLGLHPGPSVSARTIAALTPRSESESGPASDAALRELVSAHLLIPGADGRFCFHDLIRLYARELADTELDEASRHDFRLQMLDHYLHSAVNADKAIFPMRSAVQLAEPHPHAQAETFETSESATDWMTREHDVLVAVSGVAEESGFTDHAWQLPWSLTIILDRRNDWRTMAELSEQAVRAARKADDPLTLARAHCDAGYARLKIGDHDPGLAHLAVARDIWSGIGNHYGLARVERTLAIAHEAREAYPEALKHCHAALGHARATDERPTVAGALTAVAWFHALCEEYEQALSYAAEALELNRAIGNRFGVGAVLDTMALASHRLGRTREALAYYGSSQAEYVSEGDRYHQALALARIAGLHDIDGDAEQARAARAAAWAIVDELDLLDCDRVYEELGDQGS